MNKNRPRTILGILGIVTFFALFLWASNEDYKETILCSMPQEAYETIYLKLGNGCTDTQIVDEYMDNKTYYDSLFKN